MAQACITPGKPKMEFRKSWLVRTVQSSTMVDDAEEELRKLSDPKTETPDNCIEICAKNAVTVICGPNNAGKTRLLRSLTKSSATRTGKVIGESDSYHVIVGYSGAFGSVYMEGSKAKRLKPAWFSSNQFSTPSIVAEPASPSERIRYNVIKPSRTAQECRFNVNADAGKFYDMLTCTEPKYSKSCQLAKSVITIFRKMFDLDLCCVNDPDSPRVSFFLIAQKTSTELPAFFEMNSKSKVHQDYVDQYGWQSGVVGLGMQQFLGVIVPCAITRYRVENQNWKPILVCLDEPDLGLHPPHADRLGQALADLASWTEAHIVLTTHSSPLMRGTIRALRDLRNKKTDTSCQIVRVTRKQTAVLNVHDILFTTGQYDSKFPMHVMSNIIEAVTHDVVVFVEDDTDGLLYQVAIQKYLDSMVKEGSLEKDLGLGSSKNISTRDARSVIKNINWFNAHSKKGIVRFAKPLARLKVPMFALFDLDAMKNDDNNCNVNMAVLVNDDEKHKDDPYITGDPPSCPHSSAWKILEKERTDHAIKRGGILHCISPEEREGVIDGIVHCGGRNLVLNPFGEAEVLVDDEFLFEFSKSGSKMGPFIMDWLDVLESCSKLPKSKDDVVKRLNLTIRWLLRCLLQQYFGMPVAENAKEWLIENLGPFDKEFWVRKKTEEKLKFKQEKLIKANGISESGDAFYSLNVGGTWEKKMKHGNSNFSCCDENDIPDNIKDCCRHKLGNNEEKLQKEIQKLQKMMNEFSCH